MPQRAPSSALGGLARPYRRLLLLGRPSFWRRRPCGRPSGRQAGQAGGRLSAPLSLSPPPARTACGSAEREQQQESTVPPHGALTGESRGLEGGAAALAAPPALRALPAGQQQLRRQPLFAPPPLAATHSVAALAAAWDQLAPRLPLQLGLGQGAELILNALKLALAVGGGVPAAPPAARGLAVALRLADLASAGLPLDAEALAAGVLVEALCRGGGDAGGGAASAGAALQLVEARVGPGVAQLVHDVLRVRGLPSRVDIYDDEAASALRELCLSFYDARATAVEVVCRLEGLAALAASSAPKYECQVAALEALQIYAPLGHALGMGRLTAQLEDCCFQLLFPESYARTATWLRQESAAGQDALERCQAAIRQAVLGDPRFHLLASGLQLQGRTKSLFSTLKKLLRLGETARGGRSRAEIYDLMGVRAVVLPRVDLPQAEAEEAAAQACYLVREAVQSLWAVVPGRSKDYIAAPKDNGYQSLHATLRVPMGGCASPVGEEGDAAATASEDGSAGGASTTLELQIRTLAMHEAAEMGAAAHAAYKGGLAASQARQLRAWTDARRLLAERSDAAAAAATAQQGGPEAGAAAAEVLFRHLDLNGDGRISLCELRAALQELGVAGAGGQAAAEELMALVDTDADGTINLDEFLEFRQKAGLLRALSEVDHETAEQLQHQVEPSLSLSSLESEASSTCSTASSSSSSAAASGGQQRGSGGPPAAFAGLRRLRAVASPWAAARRGLLHWAAAGSNASSFTAMHVNGGGSSASSSGSGSGASGSPPSRNISAAASVDLISSASELELELEEPQPGVIALSSKQHQQQPNGSAGPRSGPPHTGGGSRGGQRAAAAAEPASSSSSSSSSSSGAEVANGAAAAAAAPPEVASPSAAVENGAHGSRHKLSRPHVARALSATMRPIVRVWQQSRPLPADADWRLVPAPGNSTPLLGSVGQPLNGLELPERGPRVVGAVRSRDCDAVLDVATVSGRHARLWVRRRPDVNTSQLFVCDLGSTNGTWVNRLRIRPWQEVALYPGDLVQFAEPDLGFIVRRGPGGGPPSVSPAAASGTEAAAAGTVGAAAAAAPGPSPAVRAALEAASALEAAAAAGGVFPPPADGEQGHVAQRARELMAAGDYVPARMLLLGQAMRQPLDGALWAQLANLERNLAKHGSSAAAGPPSCGTARAFYGAAADCYSATLDAARADALAAAAAEEEGGSGGAAAAAAPADPAAACGLVRALSSWAQMEFSAGNDRAGRALFREAIWRARALPPGACTAGGVDLPRLLFTFARREWKQGDAAQGARLAREVLEAEPGNPYALGLLAHIAAEAGQTRKARKLFESALESEPGYVAALQGWARLEADAGNLGRARELFERALALEPANTHVLTAWAVAESRAGHAGRARALFQRTLAADPGCRAALHAWATLEAEQGEGDKARELYGRVLQLSPSNAPTLSALGRLERLAGRLGEAERLLARALRSEPRLPSALNELAALCEAQGAAEEARRLRAQVQQLNEARRAQLQAGGRRRKKAQGGSGGGTEVRCVRPPQQEG